jgi:hypothetical protein
VELYPIAIAISYTPAGAQVNHFRVCPLLGNETLAQGRQGGLLPWALLVTGSVAGLAANVGVAEPTATGRVIAA